MKKAVIFAAALLAGIQTMGSSLTTYAASADSTAKKIVIDESNLTEYLAKLENLDISRLGNCTVITIPCIPGTGSDAETETPEIPGTPETETPNTPETETPDEESYHAYVLRVVELVNEERAKVGLAPLTLKEDVTEAAQVRAAEAVKSFSHTRPDGRHFSTALTEAGVSYRGAGENIAWGQKTPEQVMEGWMNSEGHRANILNEKYTSIGVGYYPSANGVNYWSQLFTY